MTVSGGVPDPGVGAEADSSMRHVFGGQPQGVMLDPSFSPGSLTPQEMVANLVLGRLLSLEPKVSIHEQQAIVIANLPAIMHKGGAVVDRQVFGLSPVLQDSYGRRCVLAYPIQGDTLPKIFYKSHSHGIWRAMVSKGVNGWAAKGMFGAENSTDAPLRLQKIFDGRAADQGEMVPVVDSRITNSLVDHGGGQGRTSHAAKLAESKMHLAGMADKPEITADQIIGSSDHNLFIPGKQPNLGDISDRWEVTEKLYGKVVKLICHSQDLSMQYLIALCNYKGKPQAWVGTVQLVGANITSLGLANRFVEIPEDLSRPPIEYGPGDSNDYEVRREKPTRFDNYITTWLDSQIS
jgi:hypothetical protein